MNLLSIVRHSAIAGALLGLTFTASAQDIAPSHLKAAREAVAAIQATAMYDDILPQAALALKQQMIQQNPNLQEQISQIVDTKILELVSRRADLEREAAAAYAKVFSEEDLKNIAAFYTSPTGKKLLEDAPIVTRSVVQAADIWQRGIARDLAQQVGEELQKVDKANETAAPVGGEPAAQQPAPN